MSTDDLISRIDRCLDENEVRADSCSIRGVAPIDLFMQLDRGLREYATREANARAIAISFTRPAPEQRPPFTTESIARILQAARDRAATHPAEAERAITLPFLELANRLHCERPSLLRRAWAWCRRAGRRTT